MTASTVAQYLAALPADRRAALNAVRKAINENLPDGYEEGIQFGMIGWYVPLSMYPAGYGENPKVPRSIRDPLRQHFSFQRFRFSEVASASKVAGPGSRRGSAAPGVARRLVGRRIK